MATGRAEVSIERNADDVWKLVREFGSLAEWMPGVETCTVDGDVRTLGMMGMQVKERLRSLDDDARTISYSLIESPMDNLESHTATIAIVPQGNGAHVMWDVDVRPDELVGIFVPIYEGSVAELKKKLEG
jgi:carbon monoxide dehydrogenase subunit G